MLACSWPDHPQGLVRIYIFPYPRFVRALRIKYDGTLFSLENYRLIILNYSFLVFRNGYALCTQLLSRGQNCVFNRKWKVYRKRPSSFASLGEGGNCTWFEHKCEPNLNVSISSLRLLWIFAVNLACIFSFLHVGVWMHPLCRLLFRLHRLSLGVHFSFLSIKPCTQDFYVSL